MNVWLFLLANSNFMDKYQKYLKYNVRVPKWILENGWNLDNKLILDNGSILENESKCNVKEVKCSFVVINNNINTNVPCILFIDDVKMLKNPELQIQEQEQIVNALLIEMNGFKENAGVLITIPQTIFTNPNQKQNPNKNVNVELSDKEPREIILCINVCNENLIIFYIHSNNLYIGVYCYHNL
jgi:hypothetical protein